MGIFFHTNSDKLSRNAASLIGVIGLPKTCEYELQSSLRDIAFAPSVFGGWWWSKGSKTAFCSKFLKGKEWKTSFKLEVSPTECAIATKCSIRTFYVLNGALHEELRLLAK